MAKRDTGEKFLNSMKARGYDNLSMSNYDLDDPLLLDKLALEGLILLNKESNLDDKPPVLKNDSKKLDAALGEKSKNPYIKARFKVLKDMPLSRRDRLEKMEKNNDLDNPDYREFTRMIIKLGDEYSNLTK
jgi:hypothetical protein